MLHKPMPGLIGLACTEQHTCSDEDVLECVLMDPGDEADGIVKVLFPMKSQNILSYV